MNLDTNIDAAAVWYRESSEAVQADIMDAIRKHGPRVGLQVISHALVEVTGSVLAAIVAEQPSARADIAGKLELIQLHVGTVGLPTQ